MHNSESKNRNIYTIPSGIRFADALTAQILKEIAHNPEKLSQYRILLPTRRACRTVRDSFLKQSQGKPLLLPTLQSIGDIEEEELSFHLVGQESAQAFHNLPAAIPKIKRQFLLARTIQAAQKKVNHNPMPFAQATGLATALGHFMDQIHTEGLDMKDLATIVPEEFANHWQITLDFLKILSEHWPNILKENNVIDYAKRRTILIETLCELWQNKPPSYPVIIAGTTGSIPSVSRLIKTISQLDQGRIILPGFDLAIDDTDWQSLQETHPQYGFKFLLNSLDITKEHIELWPHAPSTNASQRAALCREIMRPAETADRWNNISNNQNIQTTLQNAVSDIQYYACDNNDEEAAIIALALRETLEEPHKTATLITPDRNLARKVSLQLQQWNIAIDDSAGYDLSNTPPAIFMRNVREAFHQNLAPVAFLSMMRDPIIANNKCENFNKAINIIEKNCLRGLKPLDTIETIKAYLSKHQECQSASYIEEILNQLEPIKNLYNKELKEFKNLKDTLKDHIELTEKLLETLNISTEHLWAEEGEALAKIYAEILDHGSLTQNLTYDDYQETLLQLLKTVTIRPSEGIHPRLSILGQLEARLLDKDLVIMGGLNEGTWPASIAHDPWMSRPMRKEYGLPDPERSIGLSAHDFAQCLCHRNVILTRSKTNAGAPAVPARWIQRMETILGHLNISMNTLETKPYRKWNNARTSAEKQTPCTRPAPTPPIDSRPTKLSATKIERWLQDPYSIYASEILKLKPLKPLEKVPDAADKGNIIHACLDEFIKNNNKIEKNSVELLANLSQKKMDILELNPSTKSFWSIRFERAFSWYIEQEQRWREHNKPELLETYGSYVLSTDKVNFTVTAIADRIDIAQKSSHEAILEATIIDYKSGGQYTLQQILNGKKPQLPIEALILVKNGFPLHKKSTINGLSYWILSGNKDRGEEKILTENLENLIKQTEQNLKKLVSVFYDAEIPYYSIPNQNHLPAYNDYEHLARIKEWSTYDKFEEKI